MEKAERWVGERVMSELMEGMKLTNKLKEQLHNSNTSDHCSILIDEIVSCYDNALAHLSSNNKDSTHQVSDHHRLTAAADVPPKNTRKSWSKEVVVVSSETGEQQHEDGYNWRKYGQKHILGASHPRSYYRCTHRRSRECLATKHVQKGEDDPPTFKIVYTGNHSCRPNLVDKQNAQQLKHDKEDAPAPAPAPAPEPSSESYFDNIDIYHLGFQSSDSSFPLGDHLDFFLDFDDAAAFLNNVV